MIAVVWNMRNRRAAWNYLVDELRPDLALRQEFTPRREDSKHGHIVHSATDPGGLWGSAAYVEQGAARELPLPDEHRGWLMAVEVDLPGMTCWSR